MKTGIRELRDGLSRHLARIRRGEEITITDRGRDLAVIRSLRSRRTLEQTVAHLCEEGVLDPRSPGSRYDRKIDQGGDDRADAGRGLRALDSRLRCPDAGERAGCGGCPSARSRSFRKRLPLVVRVAGCELRLLELDGEVLAHPTLCPHRGGPLGEAAIEDGCVVCPWHGYCYDLRSGRCVNGQHFQLGPLPRVRVDPASGDATLSW